MIKTFEISATNLMNSINDIREVAGYLTKDNIDKYFTAHDVGHSDRMLNIISSFLNNEPEKSLNEDERYVLIAATYLHDIGMQDEIKGTTEPKVRRSRHNVIAAERIKEEPENYKIIVDYSPVIALVVEGHRIDISKDDRYKNTFKIGTNKEIRIDLLAALLQFADELDITYERVNPAKFSILAINIESKKHFFKHYYTQAININGQTGNISITLRFPKDKKIKYENIFHSLIYKKIRHSFELLLPIISGKYGIRLILKETLDPTIEIESPSFLTIDDRTLHAISNELFPASGFLNLADARNELSEREFTSELFYKGYSNFQAIINDFDIKRSVFDEVLSLLKKSIEISSHERKLCFLFIGGPAGSGKTMFLYRLFYETSITFIGENVLLNIDSSKFDIKEIMELYNREEKTIVCFIDSNLDTKRFISSLEIGTKELIDKKIPITIIFSARSNEWNNYKGKKRISVSDYKERELADLSTEEIERLLNKLEKYKLLGKLQAKSYTERKSEFEQRCGKQLLVALRETTEGKGFDEIILDEVQKLSDGFPNSARAYLYICLFYSYNLIVPEDLLERLSGCYEKEFLEKVIKPAKLIILCNIYKGHKNYQARHSVIAEIILRNHPDLFAVSERQNKFISIIKAIDRDKYFHRQIIARLISQIFTKTDDPADMEIYDSFFDERIRKEIFEIAKKSLNQNSIPEIRSWSKVFYHLGDNNKNSSLLYSILNLNPYDQKANYYLGKNLVREKNPDLEKIYSYYKRSFDSGNQEMKFILDFCNILLQTKRIRELIKLTLMAENALQISPSDKEYLDQIIEFRNKALTMCDNSKDRELYSQMLKYLSKQELESHKQLKQAEEYRNTNEKREALHCYEIYLEMIVRRPKEIIEVCAYLARDINDYNKAIKYFQERIELADYYERREDSKILHDYARMLSKLDNPNFDNIKTYYHRAIRYDPTFPWPNFELGKVYYQLKNYERAMEYLTKFMGLTEKNYNKKIVKAREEAVKLELDIKTRI